MLYKAMSHFSKTRVRTKLKVAKVVTAKPTLKAYLQTACSTSKPSSRARAPQPPWKKLTSRLPGGPSHGHSLTRPPSTQPMFQSVPRLRRHACKLSKNPSGDWNNNQCRLQTLDFSPIKNREADEPDTSLFEFVANLNRYKVHRH